MGAHLLNYIPEPQSWYSATVSHSHTRHISWTELWHYVNHKHRCGFNCGED